MQIVSRKFKEAVYAPSRKIAGKVRFEMLDNASYEDNKRSVSSQSIISKADQLTNKVREMSNKYAVLEKDYLKLDGSFILPSLPQENDDEMGWWSENISNEFGEFPPHQTVEFSFSETHSSIGLTLYFDVLNNEYATDFDIEVYDLENNLLTHEVISDNQESVFLFNHPLIDYGKIRITFKKWSKPYQRFKLTEVDFGIIWEYENAELVDMSVLQEMSLTNDTLTPDELNFKVDNSDRSFNLLNPTGFHGALQQGQECFPFFGVEVAENVFEWVQVGKYYLNNWESEDSQLTAKFTARDILETLTEEIESEVERSTSLYDLALEIMVANGIEDYDITENLQAIETKGMYKRMSYKDLLQLIAIAGRSVVYSDNVGTLHMKQLRSIKTVIRDVQVSDGAVISNKNQLLNNVIEPSFNIASFEKDRFILDGRFKIAVENMSGYEVGWWSERVSDNDGVFDVSPAITITTNQDHSSTNMEIIFDELNNEYASEFKVKIYDENNSLAVEEVVTNNASRYLYENNLLENSRKIEIVMNKWSVGNRRARVIEVGFDLPVDKLTFDNMYDEPKANLLDAVKWVEIKYYPVNLENSEILVLENTELKSGKTLQVDNPLINDVVTAQNVANWLMGEHNKIFEYSSNWRGNPAHELSDKLGIDNRYTDNTIAYLTKQEFKYQGYLKASSVAKGGI